jgi:hypothetical protein
VLTDANTGASFNRYTYANNSPYSYIDPDGRLATSHTEKPWDIEHVNGILRPRDPCGGNSCFDSNSTSVGSMPVTSQMGYLDMGIRAWFNNLMDGGKAVLGVASFALGGPSAAVGKETIVVTEASIAAALKGSSMKTLQESVSLPMIKDYVAQLVAGRIAPAIKVDGNIIVDGNHRYIAGQLVGKPVAVTEGTAAMSQVARAKPIAEIKISSTDFRFPK